VLISASSGGLAPSGTLTAFVGGNQVGSPVSIFASTNGGPTANSFGYVPLNTLPAGQATVTATYNGDSNYASSSSASATVNIVRNAFVTLTSSAPTIQAAQSATFTAKITTNQPGGPAITGTVQFQVNGANTGGPVTISNGQAQFTTASLPAGFPEIGANYSGDSNYEPDSGVISETVNAIASTTSVMTSNPSIPQGQSVTFTAQVGPAQPGGPTVTGTVQFWYSFSVGGSDTYIGNPVTISNGQAQIATSSLPTGALIIG